MGEVTISVAGRPYQLICEDGEEARLRSLAGRIDAEATQFVETSGAISEARLFLMTALMLADKLDEAETAARSDEPETPGEAAQLGMFGVELADEAVSAMTAAAARIEALAGGDDAPQTDAPQRRKSSAATEAEKDLLALLTPQEAADSADADAGAEETPEDPADTDAQEPPEDPDAERAARQAARRERLARLAEGDQGED